MLTINAKAFMKDALKALDEAQSQIPFALSKAMNATIKDVQEAEYAEMRKVFKAPTPYTLRSLYIRPATKARLEAQTWLKWGSRPEHYLLPQIMGGSRPLKRFEERLQKTGHMRADQRAVPAAGAKLDAYGNMSLGQLMQVLSQLGTDVVSGVSQNASNSKRSKAKRKAVAYFVSQGTSSRRHGFMGNRGRGIMYQQHLPAGVWERRTHSWGSSIKPVLLFVSGARYSKRLDFFGVADKVISARLPIHLDVSIRHALSTARLSKQGGLF